MTREEAIIRLKGLYGNGYTEQEQALDMAIKALEQEPSGDLISRQAVLDVWHTSYSDNREENEEIQYKKIAFELPSVNPQEPTIGQLFSCEEVEELRKKIWKQVEQEQKIDEMKQEIRLRLGLLDCIPDIMAIIDKYRAESEEGE